MKYQITINGKARTIDDVKFNAHAGAIADAYPDATILVSGGKSMSMNDFVRNRGRYSPQGVAGTVQDPVQRKVHIAPILPSYGIDTSTDAFGNKRNAGPTKISGKDLYGDIKENIAQRGYENVKKAQDEMVRKVADDPGAIEKYLDSKVERENEKASDRTTQRLEQVGSYGIPSSIANSVMKRASVIEEKDPSVIARNVIDSVTDDPVVAQFIQTSMSGANDDKSRKARAERAGQLVAQRIAQSAQKKWTTVPKSDLEYGIYNAINSSIIGNLMNAGANSIARPIEGGYSGNMLDDNALNDYGEKKASWGTKLASQIGGFMLDSPIFGASMTGGNSIVSGATRIFMERAAEGVGKEVSKAAAKAALNSTLGRKMLSNAIGMGIGGSIYGTISEGSRQVRTGQIDLPELGHGAVREFLTFSSIGWINPLTGNMLGKIASPTGKVATKAASFLGESTLFPVVGWIDRARNGENIDYVDDWVNSAAFLGTMNGMSHIGSPRSIVRNIADTYGRGVKPDNVLTENDRIQLREAGYTKINDYFNDISRRISEKDGVSVDNGLITFNKNPLINKKEISDVLSSDRISQETKSKVASLMFGKALGMRPIVEYTRDGNDFKAYDEKGELVIYRRAEKDPDKYEDSMRMATAKSKLDIINETDMHAAYDNAMYIVADQQGIDAESLAKRMEDPSDHISDMVTNVARKIFDENRTIRNIASENELADIFNSRKSMSAIQFAKVADTQRKIDEAYSALTRKDVPDTEGRDVMPTEETETPNVEDGAIEETEPKPQRVRPVLEDVSQYDKSMFDILSETHSDGNLYRIMLDNGEYGYVKKGDGTKAIDRTGEEWDIPADAERTPVQAEEFMRQASGARELLYGEDGKLITKPEQKNDIAEEYSNGIKQEDKGSASMVEPAQSDTSERMEGIEKPQPRGSSEDVRTSDKPQGTIREGRESEDGRGLEEKPAEAREAERDTEQPKDDVSKEDTSDQPTMFSEKTSDVKDSVLNHIDISDTVQSMSEKYGTSVKIVRTKDEITNQEALDAVESGRNIKGWYEPKTGDVVIYEPNATSIDDVTATYLHEVVGHKGMRGIIGEDNYGRYCDAVYKSMSEADRKIFGKSDRRKSADEYIASLAERGTSLNAWRRLVGMTRDFLRKYIDLDVCEADVEYMIWRSAKHLSGEDNTALFAVRDRVMRSIADNAREVYSAVRASIAPQPEDIMKEATQEQNDMINQSSNPVKTTALFRIPLSASEKRTEDLHNATGKRKLITKAYDKLFNRDYELYRLATEMIRDKIIDPSRNFYNAWNQKNSIASSRVEKFKSGIDSDFLQAYNNLVHRMGGKNHQDEINFYTTVRTALERQRKIADRERHKTDNYREKDYAGITYLVKELCERKGIELPQTYDSGKGYAMDMSLALQVLGESPIDALEKYAVDFEERYSPEKLWDSIHKVTDFNLENQLDGGLISEDAYQLLRYGVKFKDIVTDMEKYAELTVAERNNIDYLIEKGIIPKGDYNRYYEYYLPLKGDDGVTMEDYYDYEQNGTTGIGTVHSVKGHTNKARMPLQILRSDASRTIANAEKNKVLQEIFVTLGANPSRDRWSTSSMYLVPDNDGYRIWRNDGTDIIPPVIKRDSVTGAEIRTNVPDTKDAIAMGSTNVIKDANFEHSSNRLLHRVGLKINGSTKEIWFADKRIADILNENFSDKKVMNNKVMKLWSSLQHGYGSLMTSFSPEFAINNTFKDKRSGFKYIATKYGLGNGVIEYNKNWYAAHAAINRHFWLTRKIQNILTLGRLSEASKYDQYLKEYMEEGGATAVNQLGSRIPEMENFIRDARGATKTGRLWEGLKKFLTSISEYSELQGRLAVYATSRGLGVDKRTAMQDSKEATANFDQRGEWNSVIGSFDLFFNAKMQGVRRTWELYKAAEKTGDEKKKQRLRLAAVLGEQVLESLLRKAVYGMAMAWYYDDKDYQNMDFIDRFKYGLYTYENISSELRTRNLLYFIPGTDMIGRISLPPEEIALNRIGEYLSDVVMPSGMQRDLWYQGRFSDTMLDALADMGAEYGDTSIGNIIDNYHLWDDYKRPWFSNLTILNSQLTKPIVETIDNKDFTNRKFYDDSPYSNSLYSYEKSYYQVSDLANRISEASGDKINAYWLDHLVKGYAPGVLQMPVDVVSSIIGWSELDKDSPDYEKDKSRAIHNTPVLRMFIHSKSVNGVNKGNDRDLFYSVRKRFNYGLQNSHKKSRADKSREDLELEHLLKVYDANMKASRDIPKDEKLYRKRADEYIGVFLDKAEKYYKEGKIKLD